MTLTITHTKVATTPDDPAYEIGTTEWNDTHVLSGTVTPAQLPIATTSTLGGVIVDGTTITIDGSGIISSDGGFNNLTSGTNTTAAMHVGTGATLDATGSGTIVATSTTGNAGTATALQTARTINGTSFDGTANITVTAAAGTLTGATLNSGVTASSLTSLGAQSQALDLNSHKINNVTDPTAAQDAATKNYVDSAITGLSQRGSVRLIATTNQTGTYLNGSSGVGATFTYTATGVDTIDGGTLVLGDRIALQGQSSGFQNGIYTVTLAGAVGVAGILTRSTDYDQSAEIVEGTYFVVEEGTTNKGTLWIDTTSGAVTVGTTAIVFTELLVANQTVTLTSDITGSGAGSIATTVAKIQGTTVSGTTGTGNVVFSGSPALTGSPTVPTQTAMDNSTKAASTAYVDKANIPQKIGALGTLSHSWAAGGFGTSNGTAYFPTQGPFGKLSAMMNVPSQDIENLGIAGSYLTRQVSVFNATYSGWAAALGLVYPLADANVSDGVTDRISPSIANPKGWCIMHGINDAGLMGANTTTANFTLTRAAYKQALRTVISRLRAGSLYSSYRDSTGTIAWDSQLTFGGSGAWADTANVAINTGPATKTNATNGGTVTYTIPKDFTGGTIAMCFLAKAPAGAWAKLVTASMNNSDATTAITVTTGLGADFPGSGNFVIKMSGSSELMLVTAGQGTDAWTVTRGFNSTTKTTHAAAEEITMWAAGQVDFTTSGSNANITGSLAFSAAGAGGGGLGRSALALVKRFDCTSADAGKTIVATTSGILASDTFTSCYFDSVWCEATDCPPVVVTNIPNYSFPSGYSYVYTNSSSNWDNLNSDISSVVGEFISCVAVADIKTPFDLLNNTFVNASTKLPLVTATLADNLLNNTTPGSVAGVTITAAGGSTNFPASGTTNWVLYAGSEQLLVTASSGTYPNLTVTVTRGYNSTTIAAHASGLGCFILGGTAGVAQTGVTITQGTAGTITVGTVLTQAGEDIVVTAVTGSHPNLTIDVLRGWNNTLLNARTNNLVSNNKYFHTDNIHPGTYGCAVMAEVMYEAFQTLTASSAYSFALSGGHDTQDSQRHMLGIKDNWYQIPGLNTALATNQTFTLNKQWYYPFFVPQKCVLVGAGILTGATTAGTATNLKLGIYTVGSDRYVPSGLLCTLGTAATTSISAPAEVNCFRVLERGWYWLSLVNQGTTAGTVRTWTNLGYNGIGQPFHSEGTQPVATSFSPFYSDTGTISGALPAAAAFQIDNGPAPYFFLKFRSKHYV